MRQLNDAQPDDGLLDVAILSPRTLRHWAALGWGVLRRKQTVPGMETYTATRVQIRSKRAQPRQLDGDLIDPGRNLTVSVRPEVLLFCVPQPATDPDLAHDAGAVGGQAGRVRETAGF
ncbi:hypothetical protein Aau02nite_85620 [Amorphoplanes auranticolor]|uniref:Uncharacterized protein n=2 Tax=Actinoplanes auranticolor TaxID=47988 RepID=A0A919VWF4_9ACTN|nr:hypothetical protein Aau02nite_85620 [Actinoplanes auranticolor]